MESRKPLHIAFVCDGIAEFTAGSVISTRRFTLLLRERGHHIIFIAGRTPEHRGNDEWEGMTVYRFPSLLLPKTDNRFYMGFPRIKQLRELFKKERIDLVHIEVPTPGAISAVYAARALKIPVIVHSHTQPENLFLNAFHMRALWFGDLLSSLLYSYLHWLYAKVDVLIFPTEFSRKLFKGLPPRSRTEVVSNGVETQKYQPQDPAPLYQHFKLDPKKKYLLYVGRLHPEKRVDTLLAAMPELIKKEPQAHALVVGGGHRAQELQALSKKLGVEERVTFLGFLSDKDVEAVYSVADIFVLPSLVELEGMVVLQAIAAGNALLIANSPKSASPFLVDQNGLLFTPGDPVDLAKKAARILGDETLLKQMKARSLERAASIDISASVDKIEEVYYSLLKDA